MDKIEANFDHFEPEKSAYQQPIRLVIVFLFAFIVSPFLLITISLE